MLLGSLVRSKKKYQRIPVTGISYDSRVVKKGDIFFAIRGHQTSGSKFINESIKKGASAIIVDKKEKYKNYKIPIISTNDVRKSLAEAASKFYRKKPLNIIAVTGTNGKSSVVNFFYQILSLNKIPVASIGTLGVLSKKFNKKTTLTSIDPISLHKNLEILANNKINHAILEASSHGLEQRRLDNLKIKIGIFTNLSHDHLDYHKNMKSYFNSKMYLFNNLLSKKSTIITDEENKQFKIIKKIAKKRKIKPITIGNSSGNIKILNNKYNKDKQIVEILYRSKIFLLEIPLIGFFQVKNLLMAILAAIECGVKKNEIFKQLHKIKPVSGRLESVVNLNNNSNIILDFAHTPDALEKSLIALRKQFNKKIIIVFGCGGNRDKKKRFLMGKIAKKYCRKVFVTDDNPRDENPQSIRKEILRGCNNVAVNIGNRKEAIRKAINELGSSEILLVAGKGHEKTQSYGNKFIHFSDKNVIKEIVKKGKLKFKKINWSYLLSNKVFNKNLNYSGVSIDTKTIKKNNLFFAIKGKNKDGHKFAKEAIQKGAAASVISKKVKHLSKAKTMKVKNTFSSLNNLAKVTRENTLSQIIGITGSVGKTTLKNLISFSLNSYGKVYKSPHSYNNKFGVPLSIANLKENTQYGIFEIGMDKKGEINNLSKIVKPKIAIINNISEAHLKNFKNINGIAKAKAEIIDNIEKDGHIILNKDSKFFNFLSKKAKKNKIHVTSFSLKKRADIFLIKIIKIKKYYRLKVSVRNKIFNFDISDPINNFISNALACISTLTVLDLDLKNIERSFINFSIPNGRGDIKIVNAFNKKFKFIDESYNANPMSMLSAINNMNYYKKKRYAKKLVFLGDMLELGKKSKKFHKKLSVLINKSDIDRVFVYGKYIKETFNSLSQNKKGKIFNNLDEAYKYFNKIIHNNDLLMVKGSNATGLNKFSKNIKKGKISAI